MDREMFKKLWHENLILPRHWRLTYAPRDVTIKWPEAKADLLLFVDQMDKDWEVWEMETKK